MVIYLFFSETVVSPATYKATGELNIFLVVFFTLGAVIGALFNYYFAYYLGRPIIYRFASSGFGTMCMITPDKSATGRRLFCEKRLNLYIYREACFCNTPVDFPSGEAD